LSYEKTAAFKLGNYFAPQALAATIRALGSMKRQTSFSHA
jgi:hypothetical protein